MKKILSLIVLALFVVSMVPLAFAEDNKTVEESKRDNVKVTTAQAKEKIMDKIKNIPLLEKLREIKKLEPEKRREFQKEMLMNAVKICEQKNLANCKEKLEKRLALIDKLAAKDLERLAKISDEKLEKIKDFANLKKDEAFAKFKSEDLKARKVAKEKIEKSKNELKQIKDKSQELKEKYQNKKETIEKLKSELKDLIGEEKTKKEKEIKVKAKEFLLSITETIENHLETVESNVESSEDLNEQEAAEAQTEITEEKQAVEEAKTAVEALTEESTKEEIQSAAEKVKKAWGTIKPKVKETVGKLMNARIGGIVIKSKQLETKLARVLEKMAEKGKDTTLVSSLVDEFHAKLNEAKENYKLATETFAKEQVQEGQSYMKKAKEALKEANEVLKKIFSELKKQGMEKEVSDESNEAEEKAEEQIVETA